MGTTEEGENLKQWFSNFKEDLLPKYVCGGGARSVMQTPGSHLMKGSALECLEFALQIF